ncbi:hypothetical protein BZA05DRAFT_32589 [Tricharina praecox]|uniref:uncharacterized protein n=1 Tax=Tricharina praecox TaxID=43433 RepID=UPI0022210FA0|nr:uncharacterized protein BZA05DRAFT_32589 [Tricharina praecox]KAI5853550.1 hypothetical protein BZA05DRAFT_32589 [Tricharina praecox]
MPKRPGDDLPTRALRPSSRQRLSSSPAEITIQQAPDDGSRSVLNVPALRNGSQRRPTKSPKPHSAGEVSSFEDPSTGGSGRIEVPIIDCSTDAVSPSTKPTEPQSADTVTEVSSVGKQYMVSSAAATEAVDCRARTAPKCFRISGVPRDWSEDDLQAVLYTIDPPLKEDLDHELSIYPACCGSTKTALLNLDTLTQYFRGIEGDTTKHERVRRTGVKAKIFLTIDCHSYDFTPLNTPSGKIIAELMHLSLQLHPR